MTGVITPKMDTWKLLWTNPNPNSSFSAQTLSLDLSGYDFILVATAYYIYFAGKHYAWNLLKVDDAFTQQLMVVRESNMSSREVTVSGTGIVFGGGKINTSGVTGNECAVPEFIYGIKGVST